VTKVRATEILSERMPANTYPEDFRNGAESMIKALDLAGAFPSEESAAEIAHCVREISLNDSSPVPSNKALALWAVRLANACRAACLVTL